MVTNKDSKSALFQGCYFKSVSVATTTSTQMRTGTANLKLNKYYYGTPSKTDSEYFVSELFCLISSFLSHRDRVSAVKPSIDTKTPLSFVHKHNATSDAKAIQHKADLQSRIDRENRKLLKSLTRIVCRKPEFGPQPVVGRREDIHNRLTMQRNRDQAKIQHENQVSFASYVN